MIQALQLLKNARQKWLLIKIAEVVIFCLGLAILSFIITNSLIVSMLVFILSLAIYIAILKPKQYTLIKVCNYLDSFLPKMEFSTSLLLESEEELSLLGRIQQVKIAQQLNNNESAITFKNNILRNIVVSISLVLLGVLLHYSGFLNSLENDEIINTSNETIQFVTADSLQQKEISPNVVKQLVTINYPAYTKKNNNTTTNFNLKVLEGSIINWAVQFDKEVEAALMQIGSEEHNMSFSNPNYLKSLPVNYANIYNLKFIDKAGNSYLSELYSLEIIKDETPFIEIQEIPQFSTFDYDDEQIIEFTTSISDDFGIASATIIATVSKGSGESVKFREERLSFDTTFKKGAKQVLLNKRIDLRNMKMEPGDELYFYVEAQDLKEPKANIGRTETYFSVIRDTVTNGFAVEGTLGADLMPDYFRSQRQLIIDTEKLIAQKSVLKKQEFNFTSNELGFDQKALRLKYGEFMGDESEGAFDSSTNESSESNEDEDHLDEYTHDHDGDNDHNLVEHEQDHEHEESENSKDKEDPLEEYLHNHEDPESSTLFAKSLKSKLKQAMAEMWDAELYLRLYEPQKSLPYQYKALELIQEIKNSARIYVHRIGFDPPPIKESKRLTGDLDEIKNVIKNKELDDERLYPYMREAISRLNELLNSNGAINQQDQELFSRAGNELAILAIAKPGNYLITLQELKLLSQGSSFNTKKLKEVQSGLIAAIPNNDATPSLNTAYTNKINQLLLQEITKDD
ncbi:tryptophan-rich sensory protein [Croceitalea sp. P059]|uniref:tryptophan-rich sensory protein n=1 Tax=Croceitalea sp. P059 TaxID=3075601 RepID=UPI002886FDBC|nr:tryptophan-rich sensory protein [Croceitalea sp. P059]MDT0538256.1 tryptophan-rich sensory protein [Croceitalea sp. P059]